jgi:hypothetical protein
MLKTKSNPVERVPIDAKLKRLLFYYAASAFCATVLISGSILTETYVTSLSDTLNKFQTLKINSIKMKEASKHMDETLVNIKSIFPSYDKAESMESSILTTVDSIKSHMKGVDITVANFEKKGDEVALPVTLTGQIRDYTAFINNINYLQSLTLPLYYIDSLSITDQSDGKNAVIKFDIQGTLKMQSVNMGSGS